MKAKTICLFIIASIFSQILVAQNICSCDTALQNIVKKIETEYPGFQEKTQDTLVYNSLKKQLLIESKNTNNSDCLQLLKKYASYFKDGHIWILPNEQGISTEDKTSQQAEKLEINIPNFLKKLSETKDRLEGIWEDDIYSVGIKKTGENEYTGFVISSKNSNWKPKEIKFKLTNKKDITYYLSDYSVFNDTYEVYDNYILHINNLKSNFVKQISNEKRHSSKIKADIDFLDGFYFRNPLQKHR